MATYVNNLRLKEITTGDEDGTWGVSTNTNLALIADGFSLGTKEMAADANETFTMPDATADATRSLYLKITSAVSLTATREVTLGPNTVSKTWIIENATSGSQIITIKQGSGATVNVANGSKVIIVTDGAGAGAAVFNANPTELDSVALSSVLATGNTTGGTDLAVSTGDDITFADSSKAVFGDGNDLQIYHDGSGSYVDDQGSGPLYLRANRIDAVNLSDAAMFTAIGGNAVQLYYNGNEKLATTSTGIDVTGTATMDGLTVDGAAAFASNNILVSIQDTNAGGSGGIQFKQSTGAEVGRISFNDGEDLRFFTGSAVTERLNIDGGTGDISFYEDTGTTAKFFWDASAESLTLGGELNLRYNGSASLVDGGDSLRLRALNDVKIQNFNSTETMAQFIPAGAATLYHAGSPKLDTTATGIEVTGTATMDGLTVDGNGSVLTLDNGSNPATISNTNGNVTTNFDTTNAGRNYTIQNNSINAFRIANGDISFYEDTGTTAKFFWDASAESLGIGTDNPVESLHSAGNIRFGDTGPAELYTNSAELRLGVDRNNDNAASDITFYVNNTEKMRIDASGNVGIGTSSPARKLSVNSLGIQIAAVFESTSTNSTRIGLVDANTTGDNYVSVASSGNDLALYAGAAERMRIDSAGNVGIGTNSPVSSLHIDQNNAFTNTNITSANTNTDKGNFLRFMQVASGSIPAPDFLVGHAGDNTGDAVLRNVSSSSMKLYTNNTEKMRIDASGNVGIGNSSPTQKLDVSGTVAATNVQETVYALTGTALDAGNGGIQTKTLAANTTFTDSLASGESIVLQLEAGASYTVTWPTMQWATSGGNVAPTLTAKDTLVFWKVSSTLYGAYTGSYV